VLHQELEHAHWIARRERIGAVIVFLNEGGKKGMERGLFRTGGSVRDSTAQCFHHFDKAIQFLVRFDAFGHRPGKELAVLGGAER
jgi:hypothetical protein